MVIGGLAGRGIDRLPHRRAAPLSDACGGSIVN